MSGEIYVFGQYRLDVRERRLWRGDALVPLRDKVFDTLVLLVEHAGRLRTQQELTEALWPDVAVEPNNLQHNISVLRKALADSSIEIETLRGRGYRLLAQVSTEGDSRSAANGGTAVSDGWPVDAADPSLSSEIHFCRAQDDVRLAWAALGQGPPIVKASNWCTHVELDCSSMVWRHMLQFLSTSRQLIRYDGRGSGLSDQNVADIDFEHWVSDLEAVVAAAGVERFPLVGVSHGSAIATAYTARHPDRVSALVLISGLARGWRVKRNAGLTRMFESVMALMEDGWGRDTPVFRQMFSTAFYPKASQEQMSDFSELQRRSATPSNAIQFLSAIGDIDIRAELPKVQAPTLVMHGRNDLVVPMPDGMELAAGIPGARFVPLATENHIPLAGEPAWSRFQDELERFLAEHS